MFSSEVTASGIEMTDQSRSIIAGARRTTTSDVVTHLETSSSSGRLQGMVASWDGSLIVTARDNTARVWDTPTSTCMGELRHPRTVVALDLSTRKRQYYQKYDLLRQNSVKKRKSLWMFRSKRNEEKEQAFGEGDFLIAVADAAHDLYIWENHNYEEPLCLFRAAHTRTIRSLCFFKDNTHLISSSHDDTMKHWSVLDDTLVHTLRAHQSGVCCLDVHHETERIVSGGLDHTIKIWDRHQDEEPMRTIRQETDENLVYVQWFHEHTETDDDASGRILTATQKVARIWSVLDRDNPTTMAMDDDNDNDNDDEEEEENDEIIGSECVLEIHHPIRSMAQQGCVIVTTSRRDGGVTMWDVRTGQALYTFPSHLTSQIVCLSGDGSIMALAPNNAALVCNFTMGECMHLVGGRYADSVAAVHVTVSHDGRLVMTGNEQGQTNMWDITSGDFHRSDDPVWTETMEHKYVSLANGRFVTAGEESLCVWDTNTKQPLWFKHKRDAIACVSKIAGDVVVTGDQDGVARVYDAQTGQNLASTKALSADCPVQSVATDGHLIVTVLRNNDTSHVWKAQTGELLFDLSGHEGPIHDVDVMMDHNDSDNNKIVTASQDTTGRVWEASTGRCLLELKGHSKAVHLVSCASSGRVATAGADKSMKIWDVHQDGVCIFTVDETILRSEPQCVSMSDDGSVLATICTMNDRYDSQTVRLWSLDSFIKPGSWKRMNGLPPSPLTVNDRFLDSITSAERDPDYSWDWVHRHHTTDALSVAFVSGFMHHSKEITRYERSLLKQPRSASLENPLHLAVRTSTAAAGYLERVLRIVPQEGVRQRQIRQTNRLRSRGDALSKDLEPTYEDTNKDKHRKTWRWHKISSYARDSQFNKASSPRWRYHDDNLGSLLVQCLYYGNEPCLEVILHLFLELLTLPSEDGYFVPKTNESMPLRVFKGNNASISAKTCPHIGDDIDVTELCLLAKDHPLKFVQFIRELEAVPNYDEVIKGLTNGAMPAGASHLLAGSQDRLPRGKTAIQDEVNEFELSVDCNDDDDDDTKASFWREKQEELLESTSTVFKVLHQLAGSPLALNCSISPGLIPLKNIAGLQPDGTPSPFLVTAIQVARDTGDYSFFASEILEYVVEYKWQAFVGRAFLFDAMAFTLLFMLFMTEALLFPSYSSGHWANVIGGSILVTCLGVLVIYFVHLALNAVWRVGIREYLLDAWNVMTALSLTLVVLTLIHRITVLIRRLDNDESLEIDIVHQVSAVAMPLLAFQALGFMRGFKESGALVRMIFRIASGIVIFCFILGIFIAAFAAGFILIFNNDLVGIQMDFTTYPSALFTVFGMLFGQYTQSDLSSARSPFIASSLLLLFLFVTGIILLNLLIAIMGDRYNDVSEHAEAESTFARALLVLDFEERLSRKTRLENQEEWYPCWIQILFRGSNYGMDVGGIISERRNPATGVLIPHEEQQHAEATTLEHVEQRMNQEIARLALNVSDIKGEMKAMRKESQELAACLTSFLSTLQEKNNQES